MKRLAWIVLLGAALACEDNSAKGGVLKVSLATPNPGGDGAILLTVSGPDVPLSAAPGAGLRLFTQPLATTNKVALTGTLANGTILTIEVPDVSKASAYSATIQQVATPTYTLRALTGYTLKVAP
jgi:hypothetical protein